MVEGERDVNRELVQRLHSVLRPFILRRLKADVEKQMPQKYVEHTTRNSMTSSVHVFIKISHINWLFISGEERAH
jgi:hypothetical protein